MSLGSTFKSGISVSRGKESHRKVPIHLPGCVEVLVRVFGVELKKSRSRYYFSIKICLFGFNALYLQSKTIGMDNLLIQKMQKYFVTQPIEKAWVFGSFSRGDETEQSDIDILVSFAKEAKVTLFTIGGMYMDLKELLNREVDLVEEGTLLPFAKESADRDKILIYERAS